MIRANPVDFERLAEEATGILGWTPAAFAVSTVAEVQTAMRGWYRAQEAETERASIHAAWVINGTFSAVARAQGGKRWKPVKATDLYNRPVDRITAAARVHAAAAEVTDTDRMWLRQSAHTLSAARFGGGRRGV